MPWDGCPWPAIWERENRPSPAKNEVIERPDGPSRLRTLALLRDQAIYLRRSEIVVERGSVSDNVTRSERSISSISAEKPAKSPPRFRREARIPLRLVRSATHAVRSIVAIDVGIGLRLEKHPHYSWKAIVCTTASGLMRRSPPPGHTPRGVELGSIPTWSCRSQRPPRPTRRRPRASSLRRQGRTPCPPAHLAWVRTPRD